MYNRYVPQPDGSYCRKQMQERLPQPPKPKPCPPEKPPEIPEKPPKEPCDKEPPKIPECRQCPRQQSAGGFLRNLLPRDFDTGDLLIVLLLLIMAGDSEDGQNTALLTLALYFFM